MHAATGTAADRLLLIWDSLEVMSQGAPGPRGGGRTRVHPNQATHHRSPGARCARCQGACGRGHPKLAGSPATTAPLHPPSLLRGLLIRPVDVDRRTGLNNLNLGLFELTFACGWDFAILLFTRGVDLPWIRASRMLTVLDLSQIFSDQAMTKVDRGIPSRFTSTLSPSAIA